MSLKILKKLMETQNLSIFPWKTREKSDFSPAWPKKGIVQDFLAKYLEFFFFKLSHFLHRFQNMYRELLGKKSMKETLYLGILTYS